MLLQKKKKKKTINHPVISKILDICFQTGRSRNGSSLSLFRIKFLVSIRGQENFQNRSTHFSQVGISNYYSGRYNYIRYRTGVDGNLQNHSKDPSNRYSTALDICTNPSTFTDNKFFLPLTFTYSTFSSVTIYGQQKLTDLWFSLAYFLI